jgi:hypothetical protein
MKNEKVVEVAIGGLEVAVLTYDGKEIIVLDEFEDEEHRFSDDKECAIYVADTNFVPELFDQIKPDRLTIELLENGEPQDLSYFNMYHDDFAEFCHTHRNDTAKIERKLKRLYEDGNRFCRTHLLMHLRELKDGG